MGGLDPNNDVSPMAAVSGANGVIYLAGGSVVYRASPTAGLELVAGQPSTSGRADGTGSSATFANVQDLTVDAQGNLYVVDKFYGSPTTSTTIRKVTPAGVVTTLYTTDQASLTKVAVGTGGAIYALEQDANGANFIRRVDGATPSMVVSQMQCSTVPCSMAVKPDGTLYYATDDGIYKVANGQPVQLVGPAGTAAPAAAVTNFNRVRALAVDAQGVVYFADQNGLVLRRLDAAGTVTTIAGDDANLGYGDVDGTGTTASFNQVSKLSLDAAGTTLYATSGGVVRVVTDLSAAAARVSSILNTYEDGPVDLTWSGPTGYGVLGQPSGVAVTAQGITYVSDRNNGLIRKIAADGTMSVFAGGGLAPAADGSGQGTNAQLSQPFGLALDASGNVYVADNCVIRQITPSGLVSNLAGAPNNCGSTDGPSASARLTSVYGLTVDAAGTVYFTQYDDGKVRKVSTSGEVTTLVQGDANTTSPLKNPVGIALDAAGQLYVADLGHQQVFKVTPNGVVSVLAGQADTSGSVDGNALSTAKFTAPAAVTTDASGNVYVVQLGTLSGLGAVRQITPSGQVRTLAGGSFGYQNGVGTAAAFAFPFGLAITANGELLVVDQQNGRLRKVVPVKAPSTPATN
jgi:trimeric autotransporter adhesin